MELLNIYMSRFRVLYSRVQSSSQTGTTSLPKIMFLFLRPAGYLTISNNRNYVKILKSLDSCSQLCVLGLRQDIWTLPYDSKVDLTLLCLLVTTITTVAHVKLFQKLIFKINYYFYN